MSRVLRTGHGKAVRSSQLEALSDEDARALVNALKASGTKGRAEVEIALATGPKKKVFFRSVPVQTG